MLSSAAGKATTHNEACCARNNKSSLFFRKIWLPKLLYDSLPYFYLASGLIAFLATLYISEWFWILPQAVLFSALCFHLGIIVYRRRHKNKATVQTDDT